jgi:hypothetical protein
VEPPGRPVIATGKGADRVHRYVEAITAEAGLNPIRVRGDGVVEPVS